MADEKPWGAMDPNSQHQLWSEWTFTVQEMGKHPAYEDVRANAHRWAKQGFGTAGQMQVVQRIHGYRITVRVEGVPAHDPAYVESVKLHFKRFVEQGWGLGAISKTSVRVLAGDQQNGQPRDQLVVMPSIVLN